MSEVEEVMEVDGDEWFRTPPVQMVDVDSGTYMYEYSFSRVYVADIPNDYEFYPDSEWWSGELTDAIYYQYREKPVVIITSDGGYTKENDVESQFQVYFALSKLAEDGYVGRFVKNV